MASRLLRFEGILVSIVVKIAVRLAVNVSQDKAMHLDVTPNREYRSYEDVGLYVRSCSVQKSA